MSTATRHSGDGTGASMPRNGELTEFTHPSKYRLLLIEDDHDLQVALAEYLKHEGYEVVTCGRGDEALDTLLANGPIDLILLDIMLPGANGYEILQQVRRNGIDTPVIILTARGNHPDVMRGFETGADDYVAKPFSANLLQARIRAVLSRSKAPSDQPMDVHEFGEMKVNFTSNEVQRNGRPVDFTALEFQLLRYLINHKGRVVSRDQLLQDVWNLPSEVHTRTVDRHIASLRKKIESGSDEPQHIHTVYGRGYRFEK